MEEELPEITHLKVETPPTKETKQSSKPKVKNITLKTKVTPVPDNGTKNIEERTVTPKPKHKEKVNTLQAKTTAKVKPDKQPVPKKSTGLPRGGKTSRARGARGTSGGRGRGCGHALPIKMLFHSQPAIRKPKYIQEKTAPTSTAPSESSKGDNYSVELIKSFMAASAEQNTSIEDIMWGYIQQREEEIRKLRESKIQSKQTGSIDMLVDGKQQKINLEVNDVYSETAISHSSRSATGTQEHIKQNKPKPDEYASKYAATAWDGDGVSISEESNASEDSDGTEVYGQQLDESKEDKSEVADVEDSLVTEGEHDKVRRQSGNG